MGRERKANVGNWTVALELIEWNDLRRKVTEGGRQPTLYMRVDVMKCIPCRFNDVLRRRLVGANLGSCSGEEVRRATSHRKTLEHETTSVVEQPCAPMAMSRKVSRWGRIGSIEDARTDGIISRGFLT